MPSTPCQSPLGLGGVIRRREAPQVGPQGLAGSVGPAQLLLANGSEVEGFFLARDRPSPARYRIEGSGAIAVRSQEIAAQPVHLRGALAVRIGREELVRYMRERSASHPGDDASSSSIVEISASCSSDPRGCAPGLGTAAAPRGAPEKGSRRGGAGAGGPAHRARCRHLGRFQSSGSRGLAPPRGSDAHEPDPAPAPGGAALALVLPLAQERWRG